MKILRCGGTRLSRFVSASGGLLGTVLEALLQTARAVADGAVEKILTRGCTRESAAHQSAAFSRTQPHYKEQIISAHFGSMRRFSSRSCLALSCGSLRLPSFVTSITPAGAVSALFSIVRRSSFPATTPLRVQPAFFRQCFPRQL